MSKDELSQISDKPVKNVINIGRFAFNTRMAWLISISLFVGSGALIYSSVQPRVTTDRSVNCIFDKKELSGSEFDYRQSIGLNPNDAVAHYNLGNVLCAQGKLEEAIASY